MGSSHLRVFAGELPGGATEKQGIDWVVECMKPACEYAGKRASRWESKITAALWRDASTLLEILRRIDSPNAGINLDIANFEGKTDDEMYSDIEALRFYATHAHIRDEFGSTKRPIDLDRVWRLFAKCGYKGYMSAEYEANEDPMTGVPKLLDKIKTLCRKYSTV